MDPSEPGRFILDPAYDVYHRTPYAATIARQRTALGDTGAAAVLLEKWRATDLGYAGGVSTFPWVTSHRVFDPPGYAPDPALWKPWRPDDAKLDLPFHDFEHRHLSPVVHAEGASALLEWSGAADERLAVPARELWRLLEPRVGWEIAEYVQANDPWRDSLGLWLICGRPLLLDAMQPLALAIAKRLADFARRRGGQVTGLRFPFYEKRFASATAMLAGALLTLGQDLDLAAQLTSVVRGSMAAAGAWGDAGNPPDIIATLAAADLLLSVEPSFDPAPTSVFFDGMRNARGTWAAYGPEEPWITAEILAWRHRATASFDDRFRWPRVAAFARDAKLAMPNYAWFEQVTGLLASMPGLARMDTAMAFVDLAGFGKFNNRFGQDKGDDVLRAFAGHLATTIPGGRPCRDGGDEFLVVGTPGSARLGAELDCMRASWPAAFHAAFGEDVPPVAPRIVTVACRCGELRAARKLLGQAIAGLKARYPAPPEDGVLLRLDGVTG